MDEEDSELDVEWENLLVNLVYIIDVFIVLGFMKKFLLLGNGYRMEELGIVVSLVSFVVVFVVVLWLWKK